MLDAQILLHGPAMPDSRVLVSWIGNTDLRAMAAGMPPAKAKVVLDIAGDKPPVTGPGPLKTLVDKLAFESIHLFSDFPDAITRQYKQFLGGKVTLHATKLKNPADYPSILNAVRPVLEALKLPASAELCFHLSPGTPAMAAIWILLGKSLFPATLYQTYNGQVSIAEIPFDITVDLLPAVLKAPDRFWQHLLAAGPQEVMGFESIVGQSEAIRAVVGRARRAAIHDVPVLILGESGTGKEMFAEAIHRVSHRRDKPYHMINCAALPSNLLESELFGHVKGAFTDASKDRKGLFELADGGTLFLDEIGECHLELQAKLLRVLQPPHDQGPCHRVFRKVGADKDISADVRIVAATNRDLARRTQSGEFREDLLYRLSAITIKLPPLRQRGGDIELLADVLQASINCQFQQQHGDAYQHKILSADAKKFVSRQPWPGNVRQLRNTLVQATVMSSAAELQASDLAAAIADFPGLDPATSLDPPLGDDFEIDEYLDQVRKRFIRRAMREADGMVTRAAKLLGMPNYQTLSQQIDRFELKSEVD
ncbi:MAG: sigma 54-interacting transcriptional regulator [Pirellulaceae bacterium]